MKFLSSDATSGLKLVTPKFIKPILRLPTQDMHAELIVGIARRGAVFPEVNNRVNERERGRSMYHFWKAIPYPAKTLLCLVGGTSSGITETFREMS